MVDALQEDQEGGGGRGDGRCGGGRGRQNKYRYSVGYKMYVSDAEEELKVAPTCRRINVYQNNLHVNQLYVVSINYNHQKNLLL